MEILKAINSIMKEVKPIKKNRRGEGIRYTFRGIDDVYSALQPLLAKHGVFTTFEILSQERTERTSAKGNVMFHVLLQIRYDFWCMADTSKVSCVVVGEGMDSGDKACNKAMSVAQKYAFLQVLAIPTDEIKDPEANNHKIKPAHPAQDREIKEAAKAQTKELFEAYRLPFSRFKGKRLEDIAQTELRPFYETVKKSGSKNAQVTEFLTKAEEFLGVYEDAKTEPN